MSVSPKATFPVHPHIRGEHFPHAPGFVCSFGSSPHPWGTRFHLHCHYLTSRFIPTSVGNTPANRPMYIMHPVHPHIRGEHTILFTAKAGYCGSSPHPWGTPCPISLKQLATRFIPTSVGNTSIEAAMITGSAVHPHIRGEHVMA